MKRQPKQASLFEVFQQEELCKGCGAPIIWVTLPNGKRMPLNEKALPIGPGHYVLTSKSDGKQLGVPAESVHLNHWATCTSADQFRRGRS